MGTQLVVTDNTGAKIAKCIKVLGGSKKMLASVGDNIMVSIQSAMSSSKIKSGAVERALVVRTRKEIRRKDGYIVKFFDNAVVLVDKNNEILGTRVFGPIPKEIRDLNMKIISLAQEVC
jgi:large subunit ribosomal protein L14